MIRSDKKLDELSKVLKGGRHNEIEEMVGHLRDAEPFEGAVKMLAHFYDRTADDSLRLTISGFFNDLKEKTACHEVIEAITSVDSPATRAMLASSCWQSGLDYSEYAVDLADIYIAGDYVTSLECFTVLDTCSGLISTEDKDLIIRRMKNEIDTYEQAKQQLTKELISILTE